MPLPGARWTVVSYALTAALLAGCGSVSVSGEARDAAADAPVTADAPITADAPVTADAPPPSCSVVARTCAEVMGTFASSSTGVSVSCDDAAGTFTIRSTGVPTYASNQSTPNAIRDQGWVVTMPLRPTCAAAPTDVRNSRGPVGFMINGIPFYGPQDAEGRDALVFEGASFDDCVGHADQSCSYHYHTEPVCVFGLHDTAARHALPDGHPPVIGYALDGFALYASYASDAAHAPLDGCNGHADAARGYHYHATRTAPYLMGCYAGTSAGRQMRTMMLCGAGMMMPGGDAGMMMPGGDAGTATGPRACARTSDCAGACPAGSVGCACVMAPTELRCIPTCDANADCPTTPMGALTCDAARHVCVPAR